MKYKGISYLSQLIRIAFTVLVITAGTSISSAQNRWQVITDRQASFTVSFPGRPAYEESIVAETGQPLESYSFYYNGNLLRITYGPTVPAPRTTMQVNQLLGEIADLYARNTGTLLRQEKISDDGRQFDNLVKMPNGILHLRSRVYVRRGMTYTLSCGSYAADGIDERIAGQFFSSFGFLNDTSRQAVTTRRNTPKGLVPGGTTSNRWFTLRGPDGDFVAEFPDKPDYILDTSSPTGIPLHLYRFAYGENFFSVSYRERSLPRATPEQELKQALKNYYAAQPEWELLRLVEMPDGYLLEHRGISTGHPILTRTRLYLYRSRLYFVTSMTKNLSGPNKNDVPKFFASFRLL